VQFNDVATDAGTVRGRRGDGVSAFLGVPYAASTAGVNRFAPPRDIEPWTGVLDVLEVGPRCPQPPFPLERDLAEFGEPLGEPAGEDCLRLNVWTPAADGARRPVFVYLHGGGWVSGSGAAPAYDGANLARRGDIVVITVNHRIGILGFLSLDEVLGPAYAGAGNVGLLDVIAALHWVRRNVAAFGGDPGAVTLGGQSGGGWKTSTIMAMPAAEGLFHRAILMSGAMLTAETGDRAAALATSVVTSLGLDRSDPTAMAGVEVDRLVNEQIRLPAPDATAPYELAPVVDGKVLPVPPLAALRRGASAGVPVLIGSARDEQARMLHIFGQDLRGWLDSDDEVTERMHEVVGDHAPGLVQAYRRLRPDASATEFYVLISSDLWARIPSIVFAEARCAAGAAPVYMYRFDWSTPLHDGLGAAHGVDVPVAFDNLAAAAITRDVPDAIPVRDAVSDSWIAFIRTGDPTSAAAGSWPAYTPGERWTMLFDRQSGAVRDPAREERLAWESVPHDLLGRYRIPV
jgi:para-nitrobenzyl esterase